METQETRTARVIPSCRPQQLALALRISYFHFHGLRGALLAELGRSAEARVAFDRAIALARTPAEAAHIRHHLDALIRAT